MISIGEFARVCGVTAKTLRHYDEIGLLKPEMVDPENGYRYYASGQLKDMLRISRLKAYHFSLDEIRAVLADGTEAALCHALREKAREMQHMVAEMSAVMAALRGDIARMERGAAMMDYVDAIGVEMVRTENVCLLSVCGQIGEDGYGPFIGRLYERIAAEKLTPVGGPMAIYHSRVYDPDAGDTEIAIPVKEQVQGTRMMPRMVCARAVHRGGYSGLAAVYARLHDWLEAEGKALVDAPYEVYVSDPGQARSPGEIVTEVYFPVERIG